MKKVLVIFGILFLVMSLSLIYAEDSNNSVGDYKKSVQENAYSGNWEFVHSKIRFFYFWQNLFGGNTCGDNVCGETEFECPDDCGYFYLKNGFFNGEVYSNKISFKGEDYDFKLTGKCYYKDDSSTEEKLSKGGKMPKSTISIISSIEETFHDIEEKKSFELKNGESLYLDSEGCLPGGYVKIVSANPVCGDDQCWIGDCLQDCGGRFEVGEENSVTINYNNIDYVISLGIIKESTPTQTIVNVSFEYLDTKESFGVSMGEEIVLENGLKIKVDSLYHKNIPFWKASLIMQN
ncbi:MAG: hypothetical protein ABFQ65_01910 [Nanoarchaeota archaeon]